MKSFEMRITYRVATRHDVLTRKTMETVAGNSLARKSELQFIFA
ncbi:MAG TPA: hypothetical protein VK135_06160 [Candidatus Dormibacteraeota bacterium]|nr:hypothetical protein [Candidatus Dormibacteraeota bacterium]